MSCSASSQQHSARPVIGLDFHANESMLLATENYGVFRKHSECPDCQPHRYDAVILHSDRDGDVATETKEWLEDNLPLSNGGSNYRPRIELMGNLHTTYSQSLETAPRHTKTIIVLFTKHSDQDLRFVDATHALWSCKSEKGFHTFPLLIDFDEGQAPGCISVTDSHRVRFSTTSKYFRDTMVKLLSATLPERLQHDAHRAQCDGIWNGHRFECSAKTPTKAQDTRQSPNSQDDGCVCVVQGADDCKSQCSEACPESSSVDSGLSSYVTDPVSSLPSNPSGPPGLQTSSCPYASCLCASASLKENNADTAGETNSRQVLAVAASKADDACGNVVSEASSLAMTDVPRQLQSASCNSTREMDGDTKVDVSEPLMCNSDQYIPVAGNGLLPAPAETSAINTEEEQRDCSTMDKHMTRNEETKARQALAIETYQVDAVHAGCGDDVSEASWASTAVDRQLKSSSCNSTGESDGDTKADVSKPLMCNSDQYIVIAGLERWPAPNDTSVLNAEEEQRCGPSMNKPASTSEEAESDMPVGDPTPAVQIAVSRDTKCDQPTMNTDWKHHSQTGSRSKTSNSVDDLPCRDQDFVFPCSDLEECASEDKSQQSNASKEIDSDGSKIILITTTKKAEDPMKESPSHFSRDSCAQENHSDTGYTRPSAESHSAGKTPQRQTAEMSDPNHCRASHLSSIEQRSRHNVCSVHTRSSHQDQSDLEPDCEPSDGVASGGSDEISVRSRRQQACHERAQSLPARRGESLYQVLSESSSAQPDYLTPVFCSGNGSQDFHYLRTKPAGLEMGHDIHHIFASTSDEDQKSLDQDSVSCNKSCLVVDFQSKGTCHEYCKASDIKNDRAGYSEDICCKQNHLMSPSKVGPPFHSYTNQVNPAENRSTATGKFLQASRRHHCHLSVCNPLPSQQVPESTRKGLEFKIDRVENIIIHNHSGASSQAAVTGSEEMKQLSAPPDEKPLPIRTSGPVQ